MDLFDLSGKTALVTGGTRGIGLMMARGLLQAACVKDYLTKKGIPADRIEAVGMSADQPLVPNVTPAYKLKNRRLELHIIR